MAEEEEEENQFRAARLEKLAALRQLGVDPYPYGFARTAEAKELEQRYAALPAGAPPQDSVPGAGRLRANPHNGPFLDHPEVSRKTQVVCPQEFLSPPPFGIVER